VFENLFDIGYECDFDLDVAYCICTICLFFLLDFSKIILNFYLGRMYS